MRALFGGRRRRFLPLELVHLSYQQEDRKGDDEETGYGVDEGPVIQGNRANLLSIGQREIGSRFFTGLQHHEEVSEVYLTQEQTDWRQDNVCDEGFDDHAESRADDDADRHINDAAL